MAYGFNADKSKEEIIIPSRAWTFLEKSNQVQASGTTMISSHDYYAAYHELVILFVEESSNNYTVHGEARFDTDQIFSGTGQTGKLKKINVPKAGSSYMFSITFEYTVGTMGLTCNFQGSGTFYALIYGVNPRT